MANNTQMIRLAIDPVNPDASALASALAALRSGDVVACPTDTLYGLAADPRRRDAVERVFAIKGRAPQQAVPLIGADYAQVVAALGDLPAVADRLARTFWPGPLSLVVPAVATLTSEIHGGTGTVAVRVPNHPVARLLAKLFDYLLTATSANPSGQAPAHDADEVARALGDRVSVLVDAGPAPGGPPSTIVDVTTSPVRLVRAGAVPWDRVLRCVGE